MRQEAYFCTVKELDELGKNNIPQQLISHTHLIYSSPATLAFNSPGAEGFGVKRAGLAVPDSIMLIVSPGCCGRNTSVLSSMQAYHDRFYYLLMDETDIVTGRHLKKIPKAVAEICEGLEKKPCWPSKTDMEKMRSCEVQIWKTVPPLWNEITRLEVTKHERSFGYL